MEKSLYNTNVSNDILLGSLKSTAAIDLHSFTTSSNGTIQASLDDMNMQIDMAEKYLERLEEGIL